MVGTAVRTWEWPLMRAGIKPSSNAGAQRGISGTVHCGGVPYVVVRGDGGGLSIVKPTTPSFALCKYVIFMYIVSHYALQVQQLTP